MKNYITFTKKGLFIVFSSIVCIGFIFLKIAAVSNNDILVKTNADRLAFIRKIGYTVTDEKPTMKTVNIPDVFYDVYEKYNNLQQEANYDLSLYKGCKVTIYTYTITPINDYRGECVVNLIIYKDKVIGGDVSSSALGGFMLPLR